jgi:adenylosuccinate synthase
MTAIVVVGAQWGDEGKGKLADVLASEAKLLVQYAGGGNPGQTIAVAGNRLVFDILPPGPMRQGMGCLLAHGMALDPKLLVDELELLAEHDVSEGEVFVARRAHAILPHHVLVDELRQEEEGASGVRRRGIGPAYADKLARRGVQVGDLLSDKLEDKLAASIEGWRSIIEGLGGTVPDAREIADGYRSLGDRLAKHFVDGSKLVSDAVAGGDNVVLEAPLGTMVDLDLGAYPFVVAASTVAAGAAPGAGLPPNAIERVIGVAKAYSTRPGRGPIGAEVTGDLAKHLIEHGQEYGQDGRPRRVGMLDLAALRFARRVNGMTQLFLTKLDVLAGIDEVPVCVGYELDGEELSEPPFEGLSRATPKIEMRPGWKESIEGCRSVEELPDAARDYVRFVEEQVGVPVTMIGVGPDESATIVKESPFG